MVCDRIGQKVTAVVISRLCPQAHLIPSCNLTDLWLTVRQDPGLMESQQEWDELSWPHRHQVCPLKPLCMELGPQGAGSNKEKRSWLLIRHLLSIFRREFLLHSRNYHTASTVSPLLLLLLLSSWWCGVFAGHGLSGCRQQPLLFTVVHRPLVVSMGCTAHKAQKFGTQA